MRDRRHVALGWLAVAGVGIVAGGTGCGAKAAKTAGPLTVRDGEHRTVKLSDVPLSRLDSTQPLRHLIGCRRGNDAAYVAVPEAYSESKPLPNGMSSGKLTLRVVVRNGQAVISCSTTSA